MKREVIALWGKAKSGKSQTIKRAYDLLRLQYNNAQEEHEILGDIDIRVVLIINGVKIGIESQGDPGGRLEKSLSLFVRIGCTVIVCTTRTRGETVDIVNSLRPNYEVLRLEQNIRLGMSEQQMSNNMMAERIVREVQRAMREGE